MSNVTSVGMLTIKSRTTPSHHDSSYLHEFALWLDQHAWSTALHESLWVWPILETTHVVSITLFLGTLALVDLRVVGLIFRSFRTADFVSQVLPFTMVGFAIMIISGLVLFYANPVHYVHNIWFRAKVLLLIAAGLNAWWIHRHTGRTRDIPTEDSGWSSSQAKAAAWVSLTVWACVVILGRMIAYPWFDCGRTNSALVSFLAGCGALSS